MPRSGRPSIATLTLNPALDIACAVDRLQPGQKLRCRDVRRDPGGGGINVARVIRRLGGKATAVFPAGGATGDRLKMLLDYEGLPQRAIRIVGETREDFTAEEACTGAEYRFVFPGPNLRQAELSALLAAVEALGPDILVASGSLPPGVRKGALGTLARRARVWGARLAVDAAGPALRHALAAGVWLAKPNLAELEELTGTALPDLPSRLEACGAIVDRGGVEHLALSMGREGALLVSKEGAWFAPALPIIPVSAIGAGDSFLAGLVFALAGQRPPVQALAYAVAAGSAALLAPGTQLARASDVKAFAAKVSVERLRDTSATRSQPAAA